MLEPARIAIVGAGPAGIYVADALIKSGAALSIDILERQPAPFGLIRYGVAPDHPRIKGIVRALHAVMDDDRIRLIGNVDFGVDITLAELQERFHAVVFTTGADRGRSLVIPGAGLPGSHAGSDFVSWYNGHPDVARTWPLDAERVAVIGAGNVALDVARVLSKTSDELLATEIPDNVHQCLRASRLKEVHIFARRGPAQAKFTPLELRELGQSPNVEVLVDPADLCYDEASRDAVECDSQVRLVVRELESYAAAEPIGCPRRLYIHFFEDPTEILGSDRVQGLRTERTRLRGDGSVEGTGMFREWGVDAVYQCVGYRSTPLPCLPWDAQRDVVPHSGGRVLSTDGTPLSGVYVNGWVKRGPIGLIGHTKRDAAETVASLVEDLPYLSPPQHPGPDELTQLLAARGIRFTTWEGWGLLDAFEQELGRAQDRERVKVVDREQMIEVSSPPSPPPAWM